MGTQFFYELIRNDGDGVTGVPMHGSFNASALLFIAPLLAACGNKSTYTGASPASNPVKTARPASAEQVKIKIPEAEPCRKVFAPIGDVKPEQMWHYSLTTHPLTYSSPVVGDLDNDGQVEVVFIASTAVYANVAGVLSVVNGKTGQLIWQVPDVGALASTTPALADLDGDGFSEVIVTEMSNAGQKNLVAVNYKKRSTLFRSSVGTCGNFCMPAVADIDGDGKPEIVAGSSIYSADGKLKQALEVNSSFVPTLANLVPTSPGLEIIVDGQHVLSSSGKKLWSSNCSGGNHPYSAVADLDKDGTAELVCTSAGKMRVVDSTGVEKWVKDIPGSTGSSGAPNIGDFDGDGKFEIGTAGAAKYAVFKHSGEILWTQDIQDKSSSSTGSTVFDFNGDGKVEVVYNDELKLRIYEGNTGKILWETENPSGTLWEYPIIANIDDTPSVEIVVSAPGKGGIRAFKDPASLWVGSRKVWNQYSYFPELISDSLSVVKDPALPATGFRVNSQGKLATICK